MLGYNAKNTDELSLFDAMFEDMRKNEYKRGQIDAIKQISKNLAVEINNII